jgi:hypothetical protein
MLQTETRDFFVMRAEDVILVWHWLVTRRAGGKARTEFGQADVEALKR